MRERHRHRALGHPRQGPRQADLRAAGRRGPRRDRALHPPRTSASSPARRPSSPEIRAIVEFRPYGAEVRPVPVPGGQGEGRPAPRADRGLSRRIDDAQGRTRGGGADRADPRDRRPGRRGPDRRPWPLRRPDRDPPVPHPRGGRRHRLVRGAGSPRELECAQAGAREGQRRRSPGASAATPSGTSPRSSRTSSPTTSCPTSPGPAASPSSRRSPPSARPTTSPSRRTTRPARSTSWPAPR